MGPWRWSRCGRERTVIRGVGDGPSCLWRKGLCMRVWPGRPYPLGATWDGVGVNFALFSEHATKVELCIFNSSTDAREAHRIVMPEWTDMVWHAYLPDLAPGVRYGY